MLDRDLCLLTAIGPKRVKTAIILSVFFVPIQTMHIRVTSERTSVLRLLKQVLDQLSRPRRSPRDLTLSSWCDLEGYPEGILSPRTFRNDVSYEIR